MDMGNGDCLVVADDSVFRRGSSGIHSVVDSYAIIPLFGALQLDGFDCVSV
jgi:hypothetical protein